MHRLTGSHENYHDGVWFGDASVTDVGYQRGVSRSRSSGNGCDKASYSCLRYRTMAVGRCQQALFDSCVCAAGSSLPARGPIIDRFHV